MRTSPPPVAWGCSGVLYMTTATALEAFDATGHANCSGTPTTCSPLWRARLQRPAHRPSERDLLFTASDTLDAFDAGGVMNCSGGVCAHLLTASGASGPWPSPLASPMWWEG